MLVVASLPTKATATSPVLLPASVSLPLCSPSLRRHLRKVTDRILHAVPVLGLNEIDSIVRLQAVETVRLDLETAETRSLA